MLLAGLACLLAGLTQSHAAPVSTAKEYKIKAAFLFNFTKFVDWPAASFPETNSPIVIGVFGKDPFGVELRDAVQDRKVNGRPVVIKPLESIEQAKTVHVVFVASSEDKQVEGLLKGLRDRSVLTVGESEQFVRGEGMINFVLEGDKVRFEINMGAAERAKLKISAQLQKLAQPGPKKP